MEAFHPPRSSQKPLREPVWSACLPIRPVWGPVIHSYTAAEAKPPLCSFYLIQEAEVQPPLEKLLLY